MPVVRSVCKGRCFVVFRVRCNGCHSILWSVRRRYGFGYMRAEHVKRRSMLTRVGPVSCG
jgi:hypothetical protein